MASEIGDEELSDEQVADQQRLVGAFLDGPLRARLAAAGRIEREVEFSLALTPDEPAMPLLTGSIDLLATEADGSMLVVDYKTDRVDPGDALEALVALAYGLQRAAYALACLRAGAPRVDVVHVYLERPDEPVIASYEAAARGDIEDRLREACAGVFAGRSRSASVRTPGSARPAPVAAGSARTPTS